MSLVLIKMEYQKQALKLPVLNFDVITSKSGNGFIEKRHGDLLPNTIRCAIIEGSNCGKTNALMSLIVDLNGLRFANIYIYSKSLYQPQYQYLEKLLEPIEEINYYK